VLVDQLILPHLNLDDATGGGLVQGLALFRRRSGWPPGPSSRWWRSLKRLWM